MRRSNGLALALVIAAAVVATVAGVVHTLDDRMLHPDAVAEQGVAVLTTPNVLNTMNVLADQKVRDAFAAAGQGRPDDSYARSRRGLVASAADPAVTAAVRRSLLAQYDALLGGRVPHELVLDTTPRRAPFIDGWGTEAAYRQLLTERLHLPATIRFGHGVWLDGASGVLRAADALAPYRLLLAVLVVVLLVAAVLVAVDRRAALRRAGAGMLVAALVLYLVFDGLVAIFFRASRSIEAEVAGRLYQALVSDWLPFAVALLVAGLLLIGASLAVGRRPATVAAGEPVDA